MALFSEDALRAHDGAIDTSVCRVSVSNASTVQSRPLLNAFLPDRLSEVLLGEGFRLTCSPGDPQAY